MKMNWLLTPVALAAVLSAGCEEKTPPPPAAPKSTVGGMADAAKDAASNAADAAKTAVADAAAKLKDSFGSFTTELGNLGTSLEGVKDAPSAATNSPTINKTVEKLNTMWADMEKSAGDSWGKVKDTYKAQLDPAVKKVKDQIERLGGTDWGKPIADALKKVKLFE